MRPSRSATRFLAALALFAGPTLLHAQTPPRDTSARLNTPFDLPVRLDLRLEAKAERDQNLRCNSLEAAQISSLSGCNAGFLFPSLIPRFVLKSAGTIADQFHVNVDYDAGREFDASNVVSLYYEGKPGSRLRRVDVGNISFAPPSSRFLTSSLPSGNYGAQAIAQFGRLQFKAIFAQQTGNIVQSHRYLVDPRAAQITERDVEDRAIEPRRFFFTLDPALFRGYPNIDVLNRSQLDALRRSLPDTLRPSRVLLYRVQFGTQPQNPNGPQFQLQGVGGRGHQTYDLLREGVDYFMDRSMLWFALARELNETNERLVVAYNVKLNGRDTIWTTTGGTPDLQVVKTRDQVANLVWEPNLSPSAPAFRREIRSVYRLAGEDLVRSSTQVRVATGTGLLERPITGSDATFLQMLGLAKSTSPAEFDYDNRIWPRTTDAVFNLGAGAPDVRNGQSTDLARLFRDRFIIFPSLRPFSARDAGLVVPGNPTNDAIYTTPGEYLYSVQHPTSIYRLRLHYESTGSDAGGIITVGATQMRPGSERVVLEGRPLVRDLDYRIDYDIGRIEFLRPDTLFVLPRNVDVSYEDNPGFAPTPTTLAGFVTELPLSHGVINFSAINQSQSTNFTQPQLGFQAYSTLTAGVTAQFSWDAPLLTQLVNRLPFGATKAQSHVSLQGELASSHPQFAARNQGQAFVETFEGTAGTTVPLGDISWAYSSMPAYGHTLRGMLFDGASLFEPNRAATLAWQTYVQTPSGRRIQFKRSSIDPLAAFAGTGAEPNETVLWLSLLPLDRGGRTTSQFDWTIRNHPTGRRWRSIRTVLRPAGLDLSGDEQLEFWTLVDTGAFARGKNPTLVFDFGDVSENALRFAPETLTVVHNTNGTVDSLFTGKRLQGFDTLDTERDRFSRNFDAMSNDIGLPGDLIDSLVVFDGAIAKRLTNVPLCRGAIGALDFLGDPRTNCSRANGRLDEEDIDLDNELNFSNAQRENERLLRYIVDLNDTTKYKRLGGSYTDSIVVNGVTQARTRRWALVSLPFKTPAESLNDVDRRRIRALRLSIVSGRAQDNEDLTQIPIAQLRVTGAPWLTRRPATLAGVAGIRPEGGFVIASSIGTNDSSAAVVYQPPPGVSDQKNTKGVQFASVTEINEHSMRLQAGNVLPLHRAETFYRFPSGPQNFFAFRQLRVWGRGRGNGWGPSGELQMYVKVGRDENNFYLYRAPLNSGTTAAAWSDLTIDISRFVNLNKRIQKEYLAGKQESIACSGVDSAIVVLSPLPVGAVSHRFAACDDGYMVYTVDPAVTAPNLAAVQELAIGFVRLGNGVGASSILPSDTLEMWADDIRLDEQVNSSGFAGQIGLTFNAADFIDFRLNVGNKDPNFRLLGEQPTFLSERNVDISSTIRLDKLLPNQFGLSLPLTITRSSVGNDPLYLSQTDISGRGIPGLRKPKNDRTTYSLTVRRTTPVDAGLLGPLLNNLSARSTYVTGVDRTEYQDGQAHNFSLGLDYIVAGDSARTLDVRGNAFRWNPTQLRLTSGVVNATDRRLSYIKPAGALNEEPTVSSALSRLWLSGGVFELRPTEALTARWELQSSRDLRDYGDTTTTALVASRQRQSMFGANTGFERERSMETSVSFAPTVSSWLRPRGDLGTQYNMLRDPNVRSLVTLPGVIGVDSVLAARDSMLTAPSFTLPRRMVAAQTASAGASIDVARAFAEHTEDSTVARRIGSLFAPVDVSYSRSLLSALDAAPVGAPLLLQLGLGGPASFRHVGGLDATTAGQTGTLSASGALVLPLGTSFVNRYRRTTTLNWISRPDAPQAQIDGKQVQFPDVALRWAYRPVLPTGVVSNFDASVGYVRSDVTVSLPSLLGDAPPEVRHTHVETFPISATVAWASSRGFSTGARFSFTRRIDTLPGSIARLRGNELGLDAGRSFRIPASWGLGLRNDVRTRMGFQKTHNTTFVIDPTGAVQSRLQDNGRQAFNLTADSNVNETINLTFQGSHVITFDNNLNHRFAQTILSVVMQLQVFGGK